jgi:hypothetical protein
MKQNEIISTLIDALLEAQSNLHTATIAKVTAVNETTINCLPVLNRTFNGVSIALPEFIGVPLEVNQGGGSYTTYPVAIGDYCILSVMERCFDSWWNGQDFVSPIDARMHDFSDCFAKVGVRNKAGSLQIPDVITQNGDTLQIGDYEHQGDLYQIGDVVQVGNVDITGNVTIEGDLLVNGDINFTGLLKFNGVPGYTGIFLTGDSRTASVTSGLVMTVT